MRPYRFSLTAAIVLSLACLLLLTWLLLSLISFKTAEQDLKSRKIEESRLLARTIALLLVPAVETGTVATAVEQLLAAVAPTSDLSAVTVVDREGRLLVGTGTDRYLLEVLQQGGEKFRFNAPDSALSRYVPLLRDGKKIGALRITVSLAAENERLSKSRALFIAYFVLDFVLLLGVGSWLVSRAVVTPIRRLVAATERIAAGDLSHGVHVPVMAETAALAESFNSMVSALREKREEVDRHVAALERVNSELQAAREETIRSEKMASVGILAAGMAHEIGTPLATVLGYAEIAQAEYGENRQLAGYLDKLTQEAQRIDRLVRELLNFARPSAPEREWLDIRLFLNDLLEMLTHQGAIKHLTTRLTVDDRLPKLFIDRDQLLQVVLNLILNARDAMAQGGELSLSAALTNRRAVERDTALQKNRPLIGRRRDDFNGTFASPFPDREGREEGCLLLTISDTGSGIPPEQLPKIFDPFFTTKEPGKGTGLGLAIVARTLDALGGRITVDSTLGEGTTFRIWLPLPSENMQ